jgi:hypothetical protein
MRQRLRSRLSHVNVAAMLVFLTVLATSTVVALLAFGGGKDELSHTRRFAHLDTTARPVVRSESGNWRPAERAIGVRSARQA